MKSFKEWSTLKKCKGFNKKLSSYQWGVVGKNLQPLSDDDFKNYRTISPEDFRELKRGTCWDYVEAQREWYEEQGISHKVYYIEANNKEKASHSFLIAKIGGQFVWDEASWKSNKGLHFDESEERLIKTICEKHLKKNDADKVIVYEYSRPKKFGLSVNEFMSWVKSTSKRISTK